MAKVETVIYRSIKFRRYPESEQLADQRYYRPHSGHIEDGVESLHREVYKDHHGPIPDGWHVHHVDGDHSNNDPDNLEALPGKEHLELHGMEWSEERLEAQRKHLAEIRKLASEWHASPEGREWHKRHGKKTWEGRDPIVSTCKQCGSEFETYFSDRAKYCSNACKSAARRAAGHDDEERVCEFCDRVFVINKYSSARTCSRSCGAKLRWRER